MINDWARKDRHRRLHIVGSWAVQADPVIDVDPPARVTAKVAKYGAIIDTSFEVARFEIAGYMPGMLVRVNPQMAIDVAVDADPHPRDEDDTLSQRMRRMCAAVEILIESFEVGAGLRSKPNQRP